MDTETIAVAVADRVATVTLDRPDRLNAYTGQMGRELFGALAELDADDAVRAIVLTGAGRHFCAGADLEAGGETFADGDRWGEAAERERRVRPWKLRTPIIAAINGAAVGIGATMLLHADIRVAAEGAKIGFVFTRRGISPELCSTWILPRLIGMARATEVLLTGRMIHAAEALEIGLVSRVVARERLLETALELGRDIAANTAPVAVAATKRLLWRQLLEGDPESAKRREDEVFFWLGQQPDAAEGVEAFLEKREPRWTGALASLEAISGLL